ncbi:hypothetical protein ID854_03590 [Xenorhabdus sp. M]|uniref:Uncharacterized protein n=1 Tax=Xenorhabdus szentirmaii TaxID=290112 RepID=A0AAW3YRH9_9GAMM|nr:hypothetical protein [Xenorhabdus sp. M]MBD2799559.1 hypothetical protein [Xenorhabdus sp. M]
MIRKRSQNEAIILTAATISGIGFKKAYPLHNIADFDLVSMNGSKVLMLKSADHVEYPEIIHKTFSGGFSLQKKRKEKKRKEKKPYGLQVFRHAQSK